MSEQDSEHDDFRPEVPWGKVAAGFVVVALVMGGVGAMSGAGWFGWRQYTYGDVELFVVNFGHESRTVDITRHGTETIEPRSYELVTVVGGPQQVVVRDGSGQQIATHEFSLARSDALVRVGGEACLAASDISPMYRQTADVGPRGGVNFRVIESVPETKRLYIPGTRNVVWPRQSLPRQVDSGQGPALWVEKVGCGHLENQGTLKTYLQVRLEDRLGTNATRPTGR